MPDVVVLLLFFLDKSLIPLLPGDLQLSMLKHKAYQLLYSNEPLVQSDIEVIRAIRELDHELENWRITIPKFLRPALSISVSITPMPDLKLQQGMQHIILHLGYHHLVVTIHQIGVKRIANNPDYSFQ